MDDKELYRDRLTDYLDMITRATQPGKYICPICGSGTGRNHTAAFSVKGDRWTCFSGNHPGRNGGDIYELIGQYENLESLPEQVKRASEIFGGTGSAPQRKTPPRKAEQPQTREKTDYTAFFNDCNKHLTETDYYRGISFETLNRYHVGYFAGGKLPGYNWNTTPRLIIPTSNYSFIARDTTNAAEPKVIKSRGEMHIFNEAAIVGSDRPIFICEGEIDALSIIDLGAEAVGIGGVGGNNRLLKELDKHRPQQPLIMALDNDEAGETAAAKLLEAIKARGISCIKASNLYGDWKDANEALKAEREAFTERIKKTEGDAMKQADELKKKLEEAQREQNEPQAAQEEPQEKKIETLADYNERYNAAENLWDFYQGCTGGASTPKTPTGFKELDRMLDGGLYEGLYVIGAIPSLGKTTFCVQIADYIAKSGRDVLIVSLEMAKNEIIGKSISRLTYEIAKEAHKSAELACTYRDITDGERYKDYSKEKEDNIYFALNKYDKECAKHIYIYEGIGDLSAKGVRELVKDHIKFTGNTPVVIIDYLQMLAPYNERYSDKQNTDRAVKEIKQISRDYKLPLIAISSFNRENYTNEVAMKSFKESGHIEYTCDVLIGLQLRGVSNNEIDEMEAKRREDREIQAVILKSRNAPPGYKIDYTFKAKFNYFEEGVPQQNGYYSNYNNAIRF